MDSFIGPLFELVEKCERKPAVASCAQVGIAVHGTDGQLTIRPESARLTAVGGSQIN